MNTRVPPEVILQLVFHEYMQYLLILKLNKNSVDVQQSSFGSCRHKYKMNFHIQLYRQARNIYIGLVYCMTMFTSNTKVFKFLLSAKFVNANCGVVKGRPRS